MVSSFNQMFRGNQIPRCIKSSWDKGRMALISVLCERSMTILIDAISVLVVWLITRIEISELLVLRNM